MNSIKKHVFFFNVVSVLFLFVACEKDKINTDQVKEITIHSTYTGSNYTVWVVKPDDYNPDLTYETLYLLDAQSNHIHYKKIANITENLSLKYNKQNVIVVGISSKYDRVRDFTPTLTAYGEGGCENYSKFIEFELIPKIESNYSVDTSSKSRAIIGHSYGGLFTAYLFIKHSNIFHNYLMLSPSLWYDKEILLQSETELRPQNSSLNNLVFTACGELEESIVLVAQEWDYRLSTFYPNCKHTYHKVISRGHLASALPNAEKGLDFYFKNK